MALYFIKDTTLTGIADAIRSKTGNSASIPVADMASQILGITGGGSSDTSGESGGTATKVEYLVDYGRFNTSDTGTGGRHITHNLGVKPDLVIVWIQSSDLSLDGTYCCWFTSSSRLGLGSASINCGLSFETSNITNLNENTFYISNGSEGFRENATYRWKALAIVESEVSAGTGDHTITFMNEDGSVVLGEKPVMNGDTCGDPISAGLIDTPTKESTAQYEYTFKGWSTTAGGAADSNALVNVTKDRTVYAAFKEETRVYTIRFLDGDTVLETQHLNYGAKPSYSLATPEKPDHIFAGWIPEIATVTTDVDYQVNWSADTSALFPTQEITTSYYDYNACHRYVHSDGIEVVDGEQYKVTWDGVDYICEARSVYIKNTFNKITKTLTLGNPFNYKSHFGNAITEIRLDDANGTILADDKVPFFIETKNYSGTLIVYTTDTTGTHKLRIGPLE